MTQVRCSVNTCEFWGEGEVCKADAIWVKNSAENDIDDGLFFSFGIEFAGNSRRKGKEGDTDKSATTSRQTCCETMRPRRGSRNCN